MTPQNNYNSTKCYHRLDGSNKRGTNQKLKKFFWSSDQYRPHTLQVNTFTTLNRHFKTGQDITTHTNSDIYDKMEVLKSNFLNSTLPNKSRISRLQSLSAEKFHITNSIK